MLVFREKKKPHKLSWLNQKLNTIICKGEKKIKENKKSESWTTFVQAKVLQCDTEHICIKKNWMYL